MPLSCFKTEPTWIEGSKFASKKHKLTILVVLVFPCVPDIPIVLLNNLAYIPYGLVGYNAMQKLLKDVSVEEFRYIKIQQILGDIFTSLSKEQKDYIKDFFYNYNCSQVETDSKKDIVSLFCRISCELEFSLKKYDKDFLKEKLLEIGNLIIADAEKYFSLSPAVFLKLVSINKELTKEELQRLKTFV